MISWLSVPYAVRRALAKRVKSRGALDRENAPLEKLTLLLISILNSTLVAGRVRAGEKEIRSRRQSSRAHQKADMVHPRIVLTNMLTCPN